jgi:hypothetical protein
MWLQGKNTERQGGLTIDKGENPVEVLVKFLNNDTRWISVWDILRKAALSLNEWPTIVLQIVPVAELKSGTRNKPPTPSNSPPHTEANKKRARETPHQGKVIAFLCVRN